MTEVNKSAENVAGMFASIAPRYDFMNRLLSGGVDIYWRKYTAKSVPIPEHGRYLDICTGTADLLLEYYRRYGATAQDYTGSDFCKPMLEIARNKILKKYPNPAVPLNIEFADACNLPFPDSAYDVVTVSFGLRNTADTLQALREMYRVCKPGGTMAILEFSLPDGFLFKRLYKMYFKWILPLIGKCFARNSYNAYNYLPESVEQFPQDEQLVSLLRQANWTDITYRRLTFGISTLYMGKRNE